MTAAYNIMDTPRYNFARLSLFKPSVLLLLCLLLPGYATVALGSDTSSSKVEWPAPGPVEAHRWLIEGKAQQAVDRSFADKLFSQTDGGRIQENYDVKIYDIAIRVNDTTEILYGSVQFVAHATEPGTSEINFDLEASMVIDSIVNSSGPLTFSRAGDSVTGKQQTAGLQERKAFHQDRMVRGIGHGEVAT